MTQQTEFFFVAAFRKAVVYQFSWYTSKGDKLKGSRSYTDWLMFFSPLSRGGGQ